MSWTKTFVELEKSLHDRASFDCGEPELNDFIRKHAVKHMQAGISRTLVLPGLVHLPNQKLPISSFYSIAPSTITRDSLPQFLAKKLPKYPVPVFLLAQLAVHREFHGSGLGKICLVHALEYLWQVNSYMRAYAIIVDCITPSAETFYAKYGFEVLCEYNGRIRMYIPMKTVGQIFG